MKKGHLHIAVRTEGKNIVVYIEDIRIGIPNNLLNRFEYMASDELSLNTCYPVRMKR